MVRAQQHLGERNAFSTNHTDKLPVPARQALDQRRLHGERLRALREKDTGHAKVAVFIEVNARFGDGNGGVVHSHIEGLAHERFESGARTVRFLSWGLTFPSWFASSGTSASMSARANIISASRRSGKMFNAAVLRPGS